MFLMLLVLTTGLGFQGQARHPAPQLPPQILKNHSLPELLRRWPREYVRWIITKEEKELYKSLPNNEAKLRFIEQFWARRDPTPETPFNEFRAAYLQRFIYVTKAFAAGKPGWATDRGRLYLVLGPPHAILRNPMGRYGLERPSEIWTYNGLDIPGFPESIDINFVDFKGTGEYEIVSDLDSTAPLVTQFGTAESGLLGIAMRRGKLGMIDPRTGFGQFKDVDSTRLIMREFDLQQNLARMEDPARTLRPLNEVVSVAVHFDQIPLQAASGTVAGDGPLARVPVSLAVPYKELSFRRKEGVYLYSVEYLIKVVDDDGNLKAQAGDRLSLTIRPEEHRLAVTQHLAIDEMLRVRPGTYKLEAWVRDNNQNRVGSLRQPLVIPRLASQGLSLSSLFVSDAVVRGQEASQEPFQFGPVRVVPSFDHVFEARGKLGLYLQAYGTSQDSDGRKQLKVDFFILKNGRLFLGVPSSRLTPKEDPVGITATIPLRKCSPGDYVIKVRVTDELTKESREVESPFTVRESPATGR